MFTRSKPQPALPQPVEAGAAPIEPSLSELSFLEPKALHARLGTLITERETEARRMSRA